MTDPCHKSTPTRIRTGVARFKVWSANHYTMGGRSLMQNVICLRGRLLCEAMHSYMTRSAQVQNERQQSASMSEQGATYF